MGQFSGATVLVTGASRGLGRSIARAFGLEGAFVGVGYRAREGEAQAVVEALRAEGADGIPVRLDLRDRKSVTAAVDQLVALRGGIDVLVNNAGVSRDGFAVVMSAEDWDDVLATNLTGTFLCCKAVLPSMLSRGRGAIINISSTAAARVSVGQVNYAASKGGLELLTRTLAAEVAAKGVRVNAVVPGFLTTGMADRMDRRLAAQRRETIPLKRFGDPAEVARAVLFLASDAASYIIGQSLVVDGGLTL